jgi:hypothetical protein
MISGNYKQGRFDFLEEFACRKKLLTAGPHGKIAGNDYQIRFHLINMFNQVFA